MLAVLLVSPRLKASFGLVTVEVEGEAQEGVEGRQITGLIMYSKMTTKARRPPLMIMTCINPCRNPVSSAMSQARRVRLMFF